MLIWSVIRWLKWNKWKRSPDRPGPFLERNMKKQTSSAGFNQSVIILAGLQERESHSTEPQASILSILLTRPDLSWVKSQLVINLYSFLIINVRQSRQGGSHSKRNILLKRVLCPNLSDSYLISSLVIRMFVYFLQVTGTPGWWPRHKVARPPSKLSLLYLSPSIPDS